jgi:hypothetical protein
VKVPPITQASPVPPVGVRWVPGQNLQAQVLASLANGRFQVQVADLTLELSLPHTVSPGEHIELTVVANQPRLTFALTRDLVAVAAPAAGKVADTRPQVTLSESSRSLESLLKLIAEHAATRAPALTRPAPLLSAAPIDSKMVAAVLRNAVAQSGLFYESHQAQWIAGERSVAQLREEPQGRLAPIDPAVRAGMMVPSLGGVAAVAAGGAARGATTAATAANVVNTATAGATSRADQVGAMFAPGAATLPVHVESISLVQQQLQSLDSRHVTWQGPVWPGQEMEWRVEEHRAGDHSRNIAAVPEWQTRVRLHLPALGDVEATLWFAPQGLRIQLKAAELTTAESMSSAQDRLREAMELGGLNVLAMSIAQHENA